MALVVEDGTGVADANAYADATFVTAYLTDRQRQTENSWSSVAAPLRDAAIIAATDYIEHRWGQRFLGRRQFRDISAARATLTLTSQPLDTETITLDTVVYTFNTVLGGANSVLIGATVDASIVNLVNAIRATVAQSGVTHGVGTVVHPTITPDEGIGDTMIAEAREKGTAGNGIASTETLTNGSWSTTTLLGGGDVLVPQPLAFPRLGLLDREGLEVLGIPLRLKQAMAEYAVRAISSMLAPDPVIDDTARAVIRKREEIGPIKEETQYEEGASISQTLRPYPAADRLLQEYVKTGGRTIRG